MESTVLRPVTLVSHETESSRTTALCILARSLAPIPPGMTAVDTAPLMCDGLTIWNALGQGNVRLDKGKQGGEGMTVAISGAGGGLGHLGVRFAAKLACKVVAIDVSDAALSLVRRVVDGLGPLASRATVVDARVQPAKDVRLAVFGKPEPALEGEKGVDSVLIFPEAQQVLEYGMRLLKDHGTCVTVSFPKEGFRIQPRDLVFRHIKMVGVIVGRNHQLRAMLNFAAQEEVLDISRTYPLGKLNDLVNDYSNGAGGKLVINMTNE